MSKTKVLTTIIWGGVLAFALPFLRDDWSMSSFCDGFSVVGVLFLSYVGLQFLRNKNAFFGVSFLWKRIKSYFFPFMERENKESSVSVEERKNQGIDKAVLSVGIGYLGIALIFLFFI